MLKKSIRANYWIGKNLKVASLFSGCGGLDLGFAGGFDFRGRRFEKNLFELVFANDFDKDATNTYSANQSFFGPRHEILNQDIRSVSIDEIPSFDVLLAGFPCQPFSNAGKREGVEDTDGRGTLFYECERIIKQERKRTGSLPKYFVFENVRGIVSSKMPDGTLVIDEISKRMSKLGYNVVGKLIRASDFGVPQNRYRYLIIGSRKDQPPFDFGYLDLVRAEYNLPSVELGTDYELRLGSVFSDLPLSSQGASDYWAYSPGGQFMVDEIGPVVGGAEVLKMFRKKTPLEKLPESAFIGKSWKNVDFEKLPERFRKIARDPKRYHAPNFYRRFALGEIAGTITASAQPENCGITHPYLNRRMTIREAARIQSFPDDFIFPHTSIASAYKVIGNAVPPVLGWVVARAIQKHAESQT